MPTVDCGHWNGRRNRLPHLAGSIVWRSRWGRRFRLPVEADFHRKSKSRKRYAPQHGQLYAKHTENAQEVDKPIAGLRGLLKDTLVIWAGEFGRDHNPYGYSIWLHPITRSR